MYRLGLNNTLSVVAHSLKHGGYRLFVDSGNIYVADLEKESVVHHRNGLITYKDCYLVKDKYITYDDAYGDYVLSDCGGKEYKIVAKEYSFYRVETIKKYREKYTIFCYSDEYGDNLVCCEQTSDYKKAVDIANELLKKFERVEILDKFGEKVY